LPREFDIEFPDTAQYVLATVFPCAFTLAIDQALYSQAKYGSEFTFSLLMSESRPNTLSIFDCTIMLFIDGVVYFLLAIYFDQVIQSEYGRAKPFLFFLSPSYWFDTKRDREFTSDENNLELENNEAYEPISDELKSQVGLRSVNHFPMF
jgi:hypothetical protein